MDNPIIQALRRARQAYMTNVGEPTAQLVGGGVRGYFGLDAPEYADSRGMEAYRNAQALGNAPGVGAPAGAFKAMAAAPLMIQALRKAPKELSIERPGNPIQGAVVMIGDKMFLGRTHGDALNRAIFEGVVRKQGDKYVYPKGADVDMDLFMTNDGRLIDRFGAYSMLDVGASETAIEKGLMQNTPARSMTVESYREQARKKQQAE